MSVHRGKKCRDCSEGEHLTAAHSEIGCLETLAPPPDDHVCACKVPVKREIGGRDSEPERETPRRVRRIAARSSRD